MQKTVFSSSIISNFNHIQLHYHGLMDISNFIVRSMSKETPKKVYRSVESAIDLSSCHLCCAIGDPSHRKNLFKPSNRALLRIAERIVDTVSYRIQVCLIWSAGLASVG